MRALGSVGLLGAVNGVFGTITTSGAATFGGAATSSSTFTGLGFVLTEAATTDRNLLWRKGGFTVWADRLGGSTNNRDTRRFNASGVFQGAPMQLLFDGTVVIGDQYLRLGSSSGPRVLSGSGTPEAAITAPVGSLYLRTNGGASTSLYIKETGSGNTGWRAV